MHKSIANIERKRLLTEKQKPKVNLKCPTCRRSIRLAESGVVEPHEMAEGVECSQGQKPIGNAQKLATQHAQREYAQTLADHF